MYLRIFSISVLILLKIADKGAFKIHLPKLCPELLNGSNHMTLYNKFRIFSGRDFSQFKILGNISTVKISRKLGITPQAVSSTMARARMKIYRILQYYI